MDDNIEARDEVAAVADGNSIFGSRLYGLLREEEGNIIMSPFSVSGVMAMVGAGAAGNTLTQVQNGMSFPPSGQLALGYRDAIPALRTNNNFTLEAANSVFGQAGFDILPSFKQTLHEHFHASYQETDFAENKKASKLINDWVESITQEKIKDLIKPDMLNANTKLVLVNAIYFKGDWQRKFDPKFTSLEDFQLRDGSTNKVPMMQQTIDKTQFAVLDSLAATMVELPYKGDRIVMQLLLPEGGRLPQLEEKLRTTEDLQVLWDDAKGTEKVKVTLPKFKLEQTIPLTPHLQALGMSDMFDSSKADFSAIDGTRGLFVSTVIQKAFIEVNEEGSEAAAATGAVMMMRSMPSPPEEFRADRPFLFFLRDKLTGMLLFQGRVEDPAA